MAISAQISTAEASSGRGDRRRESKGPFCRAEITFRGAALRESDSGAERTAERRATGNKQLDIICHSLESGRLDEANSWKRDYGVSKYPSPRANNETKTRATPYFLVSPRGGNASSRQLSAMIVKGQAARSRFSFRPTVSFHGPLLSKGNFHRWAFKYEH